MNKVQRFIADRLAIFVENGGIKVSEENYEARKAICEACPFHGAVEPVPNIILPGCRICGCPTETKAKMLLILSEVVATVLNVAAKPGHKVITGEKIICPHKEENKWAEVDQLYQQNKVT